MISVELIGSITELASGSVKLTIEGVMNPSSNLEKGTGNFMIETYSQ